MRTVREFTGFEWQGVTNETITGLAVAAKEKLESLVADQMSDNDSVGLEVKITTILNDPKLPPTE